MQSRWIRVRIASQVLELLEGNEVVASYPVSTAAKGVGERMGSEQTPRGKHEVKELIGDGAPSGAVFVGRGRPVRFVHLSCEWRIRTATGFCLA
jgi:L,D-transpeptidase YbiS